MTSPMIDTVRNIPLIIEKDVPMEADDDDSGFPFDREDRDDHLRSQLDDIAKRHPEFAEHFEGFPFRSETLGRRRPPRPSESEFRRFTDRPFGSGRFERLFRDPFDHEEFEEPQHHQPQQQQQQQQEQPQPEQKVEEEEKPKPERSRKQNIQQSNTVDLGQKQEPVNDRNQRSMSAPPPDNRPRYVSSINIPINRDGAVGNMGTQQSQPQQQQPPQPDKPVERVIPIHVEGRDEPVMPKHTGPSFSQPQTERTFGGQRPQERVFEHPPQSERIFGQRPGTFTQFVPPKQQFEPEVKPQQKFQQQASPPPPPQQQQQQPPPPPQPKATTPIDIIQSIQKDVSELMTQVENFTGQPRDKQYLYLDEMLTRNLIKLDNIDTQGQENIRQARKEAIKCIERCISLLEAKAAANVPQEKKPVEEESQPKEEKMEVEVKEPSPKPEEKIEEATVPPQPNEEKMEVNIEKTDVEEPKIETSEPLPPPQEEKPTSENKPTNEEIIPLPPPAEENTKKDSESNEETSEKK